MKHGKLALATLGLLAAIGARAEAPANMLGEPVAADAATRTVQIDPSTRYVNVAAGETVRFVANGQEFGFEFDGSPAVRAFDLQRVAPPGALDHPVTAYVDIDPGGRPS